MRLPSVVNAYVCDSLRASLPSLGLSDSTIDALVALDVDDHAGLATFRKRHASELDRAYWRGFRECNVPVLYATYVLPYVPSTGTWLDIGCGCGGLLRQGAPARHGRAIGIDLNMHANWDTASGIEFHTVAPDQGAAAVSALRPHCVTLTWALHHMAFAEQEGWFSALSGLPVGASAIILEDAYAASLPPRYGAPWHERFMRLSATARHDAMRELDTIANRVLAGDDAMPVPGTFRTLEEWARLGRAHGFRVRAKDYLGFPRGRDVYTPQSLLVLERDSTHAARATS